MCGWLSLAQPSNDCVIGPRRRGRRRSRPPGAAAAPSAPMNLISSDSLSQLGRSGAPRDAGWTGGWAATLDGAHGTPHACPATIFPPRVCSLVQRFHGCHSPVFCSTEVLLSASGSEGRSTRRRSQEGVGKRAHGCSLFRVSGRVTQDLPPSNPARAPFSRPPRTQLRVCLLICTFFLLGNAFSALLTRMQARAHISANPRRAARGLGVARRRHPQLSNPSLRLSSLA